MNSLPDSVFVGRQQEMVALKAALDDVFAGRGRVVTLAGEPGIGKTRTSQELAAYAHTRGAQVLWGRCHAAEGAPPYWPWVQVIRFYVRERDAEQLRSQMGAGAADIAEVIAEVKEVLTDLEPPPALEPQQARFRLFDSITRFFKQASEAQPLMVVLDNLHWADQPSLLLLEFLAQEMAECRLLLLGTYRETELTRQHPLTSSLGELSREPLLRRVPLRGLSEKEVGRFIEVVSGFAPPHDLTNAVYAQTEGNPLFMTEVVRLLVQEGQLAPVRAREGDGWRILIPAGVREVIGRRLDRLSERCNQVLTVASVVGREFELGLLERLMNEISSNDLLQVVEEALAARVVEELPNVVGRYQFAHVLIQDTLAHELSGARRARLHRRIAEALEALYGADVEAHAAELAHHFDQTVPLLGRDKLVRYSLLAGERALAAYAWEDAQAHFQRGLAAKGVPLAGAEPAEDAESARLLFGMGRAQAAMYSFLPGYIQEAVANLKRAFQYYVQAGELDRAVAIAEYPVRPQVGVHAGLDGLVGPALTMVSPNSQQESRLLAIYGRMKGMEEGDYQAAETALQKALTIALQSSDQALEMGILAEAAQVDFYHLRLPEALRKSLRALELSSSLSDRRIDCAGGFAASMAAFFSGQLAVGQLHAEAMLAAAERLRDRWWLHLALAQCEKACSLRGDWTAARRFSERGLLVTPESPILLSSRVTLELEVGECEEAELYLRRLLETLEASPPRPTGNYAFAAYNTGMAGWITGAAVRFDLAQRVAQTVVSSPFATPTFSTVARIGQALIAVTQGDGPACEKLYIGLQPPRGMFSWSTSTDRVLGLLAHTMGNLDKAMAHFEDALAFCRRAGYRPELAWTCHDYAEALLGNPAMAPGRDGSRTAPTRIDNAKAASLLDEALAISTELGMRPLMERVGALRDRVASGPEAIPAYPDRLTQREVEVLRLIAAGKSNHEIAEKLVLSVRTVERHITNIYRKINARGRADATAYAFSHGLTQQP